MPTGALDIFGARLPLAERYAQSLVDTAIPWGLLGPAEAARIWSRHVLNSAVLIDLIPADASVLDVGSGAGLPGIPLAIARPDLRLTLLEPLERRVRYLDMVVRDLGLASAQVQRGRAEQATGTYDVVTARAVAPLTKLLGHARHLMASHGAMVLLKGQRVTEELAEAAPLLRRWRLRADLHSVPGSELPTMVVRVTREGSHS